MTRSTDPMLALIHKLADSPHSCGGDFPEPGTCLGCEARAVLSGLDGIPSMLEVLELLDDAYWSFDLGKRDKRTMMPIQTAMVKGRAILSSLRASHLIA